MSYVGQERSYLGTRTCSDRQCERGVAPVWLVHWGLRDMHPVPTVVTHQRRPGAING